MAPDNRKRGGHGTHVGKRAPFDIEIQKREVGMEKKKKGTEDRRFYVIGPRWVEEMEVGTVRSLQDPSERTMGGEGVGIREGRTSASSEKSSSFLKGGGGVRATGKG